MPKAQANRKPVRSTALPVVGVNSAAVPASSQIRRVATSRLGQTDRELTERQVLAIHCPACGAAAGSRCEMVGAGSVRFRPHQIRKLLAWQVVRVLTQPRTASWEYPVLLPVNLRTFD